MQYKKLESFLERRDRTYSGLWLTLLVHWGGLCHVKAQATCTWPDSFPGGPTGISWTSQPAPTPPTNMQCSVELVSLASLPATFTSALVICDCSHQPVDRQHAVEGRRCLEVVTSQRLSVLLVGTATLKLNAERRGSEWTRLFRTNRAILRQVFASLTVVVVQLWQYGISKLP